jgi:serine/threonine-protein kinase
MSTSAEPPSREGELLAQKYRLEKRLGTGGQGEVYRARNELIGREVAIKLLRGEWAADTTTVTRFVREARAANMVRHPNVVDVLDLGTDISGAPFIVQELLSGESLDGYLDSRGGRLLPPEVYDLAIPVCDGVGAAHARGVIHRDLKPGNVFLVKQGTAVIPKVLDFGLSKISESHGETDVTTTGAWFGTPAYMPPEQIRHTRTVDARSDVWALGVMLYEMLAGRRPFDSHTVGDLFVVICTEDPIPLREFAPHVSDSLARVVHRCILREPDRRYANAAELAKHLEAARRGTDLLAVTADPEREREGEPERDAATVGGSRDEQRRSETGETRVHGRAVDAQPTKRRTPPDAGRAASAHAALADDVASSQTLEARPLGSNVDVINVSAVSHAAPAKPQTARSTGDVHNDAPSSTSPAEISNPRTRAAPGRARSWSLAAALLGVIAGAGFLGLRARETRVSAPSAPMREPTPATAPRNVPRVATEPPPNAPASSIATPVRATVPTPPTPPANTPAQASNEPHPAHHAHHVTNASTRSAAGSTSTAPPPAAITASPSAPSATTQPANGALPAREVHGATRYE